MEAEAEATMICVDNSRWMIAPVFQEQADAIKYYCTEKLNANPRNVVGISSMSDYNPYNADPTIATYPTRDLKTIMRGVYGLPLGGKLLLVDSVVDAQLVWCCDLLNHDRDLKKWIVVFAGVYIYDDTANAKRLGLWLKNKDIAFDAVNFAHQSSHKREELFETLVAAAENKRNSRILHVEPHLSVSQALASSQIIPTRVGESSSPPLDIKDKEYYSQISSGRTRDIIAKSIERVLADIYAHAAQKAAAIALPED
ncbi:26S proteasome non-ATPase regulatory subunit 4 [Tanacetum coccineum]